MTAAFGRSGDNRRWGDVWVRMITSRPAGGCCANFTYGQHIIIDIGPRKRLSFASGGAIYWRREKHYCKQQPSRLQPRGKTYTRAKMFLVGDIEDVMAPSKQTAACFCRMKPLQISTPSFTTKCSVFNERFRFCSHQWIPFSRHRKFNTW